VPGRRVDLTSAAACVLTLVMLAAYLLVLGGQDGSPAMWAVAVFGVAVAGTAYATSLRATYRRPVLVLCAVLLLALGLLAIFSIGLPILVAGLLCIAAVLRQGPAESST
jgi:hypothetical protein